MPSNSFIAIATGVTIMVGWFCLAVGYCAGLRAGRLAEMADAAGNKCLRDVAAPGQALIRTGMKAGARIDRGEPVVVFNGEIYGVPSSDKRR